MRKNDALSFDRVARTYSDARPGYPREVYDFIDSWKSFGPDSRILEVGAGHGVATKEIRSYWDAELTALEPGENLRALLRKNLAGDTRVRVVNGTFEAFVPDGPYDGIISATAYHWIDPEVKYRKAYGMLKDDGVLALFWNNFSVADPEIAADIEAVYANYWPSGEAGADYRAAQLQVMEGRKAELEESGWFSLAGHGLIEHRIPFTQDRYVDLLKTFSDHSRRDPARMALFYAEIGDVIRGVGGSIEVRILVNVEIGRKRVQPAIA